MQIPSIEKYRLNNGDEIPRLGFGTYKLLGDTCYRSVMIALKTGYELIDTAQAYDNETEVGKALLDSGRERKKIFITTKISDSNQGYENTLRSIKKSLESLKIDYLDLLLIHWPREDDFSTTLESWRAMLKMNMDGLVQSIGVSNFTINMIEQVFSIYGVMPAVNQVEFHPFLYQKELLDHAYERGIVVQAFSPITRGRRIDHPLISSIAKEHRKTPTQIMLAWSMAHGLIPLPRSSKPAHILENFQALDISLSPQEVLTIDALNENDRMVKPSWAPKEW